MRKMITAWWNRYWIHFVIWTVFMLYETVVIGLIYKIWGDPLNYLLHYLIIILFFYLASHWVLNWGMKKRSNAFLRIPLGYILLTGAFILANFLVDYLLIRYELIGNQNQVHLSLPYILKLLYRSIYFFGFATAYFFLAGFLRMRKKSELLERERLHTIIDEKQMELSLVHAEMKYLKAQINPHFLFNTLDFIARQADDLSPETSQAIIVLSDMMRYAISSNEKQGLTKLSDEIEQLDKLIFISRLKKSNIQEIYFFVSEGLENILFPPLVLLTLGENIFKHGLLGADSEPIEIRIELTDSGLSIITRNPIAPRINYPSSSKGLENIRKQLQHSYHEGLYFQHGPSDRTFEVRIEVALGNLIVDI